MSDTPRLPHNEWPVRLAAIDVGTNSIRLLVAEMRSGAGGGGGYRVIDDEKEIARLGRGMAASGELSAEVMERAADAIARMKDIADGYRVREIRAIGTCAVREAANADEFITLVRHRAGVELVPISAEEEARLAYQSVAHFFDLRAVNAAVVDVGGGSTEIVLSSRGVVEHVYTLPLGAVRLTETFDLADRADNERYEKMREKIGALLKQHIGRPPFVPQLLIGTGGTFTALGSVSMQRGAPPAESDLLPLGVRGYEMQRSEVRHLLDQMRKMPLRARARLPGLSPERAEIIVAGAAIAEMVMKRLGANYLRVHDRGIRDGLLLGMIREMTGGDGRPEESPHDRARAVRRFASSCNYERQHSEHVTRLALELFEQIDESSAVVGGVWTREQARALLEAAAVLHDIGYAINYSKHHKHSYHLIVHSELIGFTKREIEIIANVARYHRGAKPKKKHANYAKLDDDDRALVRRLAAILRIADGLDRTHTQSVRSIRLRLHDGRARLLIEADSDPAVNLWGANQKGRLFEKTFGMRLELEWCGSPPAIEHVADERRLVEVPDASNN